MEDPNVPQQPQQPQAPQYAPQQPQYQQPYQQPQYQQAPQYGPQQPQYQQPYQQPQYPQYQPKPVNGLGIAGFVLSLVGIIFLWVPFFDAIVSLIGLVLSGFGMKKNPMVLQLPVL